MNHTKNRKQHQWYVFSERIIIPVEDLDMSSIIIR
jgi:hypothetical protein